MTSTTLRCKYCGRPKLYKVSVILYIIIEFGMDPGTFSIYDAGTIKCCVKKACFSCINNHKNIILFISKLIHSLISRTHRNVNKHVVIVNFFANKVMMCETSITSACAVWQETWARCWRDSGYSTRQTHVSRCWCRRPANTSSWRPERFIYRSVSRILPPGGASLLSMLLAYILFEDKI